MSEVLGSFSADHAALYTAYRNIIPNELSFVFQKGGLSIYFLISTSCFPGGVPATKYKNHFLICSSSRQHQPRMLDNAGSVSLVFNYSTPRCVFMAPVSSAVFCDSNVDLRGVFSKRIVASVIILMGVFSWRKNISYFVQIYFQLLTVLLFSSQLPADLRYRHCFTFVEVNNWWLLTSVAFTFTKSFSKCKSQNLKFKGALKIAECLKQSV